MGGGATVVTFDDVGDEGIVRDFMWNNYAEAMQADPAYFKQQGYWTGYVRKYGDCPDSKKTFCSDSSPYVNVYSGELMNVEHFLKDKPDNYVLGEYGQEDCISRRDFWKDNKKIPGLDDFTCGFPHWIICMHRDVFGLNKKAYNTALMNNSVTLPPNGKCQLDWVNHNFFQLNNMATKRPESTDIYLTALPQIRSPTSSVRLLNQEVFITLQTLKQHQSNTLLVLKHNRIMRREQKMSNDVNHNRVIGIIVIIKINSIQS